MLVNGRARIAEIDKTLETFSHGRAVPMIIVLGIIGFISYDLSMNGQDISTLRKTLDWIGLSVCTLGLGGFFVDLANIHALKKERKTLEAMCLQAESNINAQLQRDLQAWGKAKAINTIMSYQK